MGSMGSRSGQVAEMMLDAYNCWRVEPLLQHLDPKVEWRPALLVLLEGEATVYRGHDGVRRMFRDFRRRSPRSRSSPLRFGTSETW